MTRLSSGWWPGPPAWTVGDPQDPATRLGPMIERPHLDKVLGYIATGRDEGARVVAGGGRTLEETGGYFVAPTILDDVRNTMTVAREEIFGPVISTIPVDSRGGGHRARQPDELRAGRVRLHDGPRHGHPRRTFAASRHGRGQRLLRGRHHDAVRWLQGVRLRRSRQGSRGVRAVHPEEDDLVQPSRLGALRASNPSLRASPTVSGATRRHVNAVAIASQTGGSSQ